jgi:hypothetical protein
LWANNEVFVVSHKTRHPILGPKYDMHAAARNFLVAQRIAGEEAGLIATANVYFELTKEEKIARAAALDLDVFIDDLPEILTMPGFPERTRPLLFDPNRSYVSGVLGREDIAVCSIWDEIAATVLGPAL